MDDYGRSTQGSVNCLYDRKRRERECRGRICLHDVTMKFLTANVQIGEMLTRFTYRLTCCLVPLHIHWFSMKAQRFYFVHNKRFSKKRHHQKAWYFCCCLVYVFFNRWPAFLWVQSVHLFSPTYSFIPRLHLEASQENRKESNHILWFSV
jgi:hypothetical protein